MISTAKLRYLRIAPRKVRLVADLIRGKTVKKAESILAFTRKGAVLPTLKLLKQAVANAKDGFQIDESNLYISKIIVDEGTKYKRQLPRARGRADIILKKTSHITLVLDEIDKSKKKEKVKKPSLSKAKADKKTVKGEKEKAGTVKQQVSEEKDEEVKEVVEKKIRQKFEPERIKPEKQKGLRRFFRRKAF